MADIKISFSSKIEKAILIGSELKFKTMLSNLINNSVQAIPEGRTGYDKSSTLE